MGMLEKIDFNLSQDLCKKKKKKKKTSAIVNEVTVKSWCVLIFVCCWVRCNI